MTTSRPLTAAPAAPALLAAILAASLTACGTTGARSTYDDDLYAAAVCVDPNGIRVPDDYCPIGDGVLNAGYGWDYATYRGSQPTVVVPLVGYPVDRHVYVHDVPARVSTLHIDRGSFPERAAPGTRASSVTLPTVPKRTGNTSVQRGGLGIRGGKYSTTAAAPKASPTAPKTRVSAPPRKAKK